MHSLIDADIKDQATFILEKIGLNVSDAIRLFLNQVVMRKGMPFPVCIPNSETIEALESADRNDSLEDVTLEHLQKQFNNERKKILKIKKNKK